VTASHRSPRGLVYQPNDWSSYYPSASRPINWQRATGVIDPGSAIQPPEITASAANWQQAAPERRRPELGLSLFQIIKENVPTCDPSDPGPSQEITAEGVEFSAPGRSRHARAYRRITYLDARVTQSNNNGTSDYPKNPSPRHHN
jgi:catecholate siderophore receptor